MPLSKPFYAFCVLLTLSCPAFGQAKVKPQDLAMAAVKAINSGSTKALHEMGAKEFKDKVTVAQLDGTFKGLKARFGKFNEELISDNLPGPHVVFRVQAERRSVFMKLLLNKENQLLGLTVTPAFLERIPATLTLPEIESLFSDIVAQTLRDFKVPSISVAMVKGDQIVWASAMGQQNVAKAIPADTETVYVTGSIEKLMVATALMQLVDEGKLDLDAPVNNYLKDQPIANSFEKEVPLTARHLLSHHGGVVNGAQIVSMWQRTLPLGLDDVIKKRVRVTSKPGEKFQYSNYGYTLNGYLLGKLADTSFERAMRKRLLEPLEMTRTVLDPTPAVCENMAIPYETGNDGKLTPTNRVRLDVYPAGDLYSTPSDMARFLIPHLNEGKYKDKQILSAKSVQEMATLQFAKKGERGGVGLGWMVQPVRGKRVLWHNGAVPGFFTYVAIHPATKSGVVLFCNKYKPIEVLLGVYADALADLREYAIELLDRLPTPAREIKAPDAPGGASGR